MGMDTKTVGGGPATGLAENYTSGLQQLFNGGGMGTAGSPDPIGSTHNIMGILSDLFSGGGGKAGGNIAQILSKQQERDVGGLRARFTAGGGTAFGTPAAYAESLYRSEAAPQITQAITGLQLQAMAPLLSHMFGLSQLGIPQAQTVQQKTGFGQFLDVLSGVGKNIAPFLAPGIGANKERNFNPRGVVDNNPSYFPTGYIPATRNV